MKSTVKHNYFSTCAVSREKRQKKARIFTRKNTNKNSPAPPTPRHLPGKNPLRDPNNSPC